MLNLKERYMKMKESYAQISSYEGRNAELAAQVSEWRAKHRDVETELLLTREKLREQRQKSQEEDSSLHQTQHQLNKLQNIVQQAATAIKYTVEVRLSEQIIGYSIKLSVCLMYKICINL